MSTRRQRGARRIRIARQDVLQSPRAPQTLQLCPYCVERRLVNPGTSWGRATLRQNQLADKFNQPYLANGDVLGRSKPATHIQSGLAVPRRQSGGSSAARAG